MAEVASDLVEESFKLTKIYQHRRDVFVDWLAVAPECPRELGFVFIFLFGSTWLTQRFVPAA